MRVVKQLTIFLGVIFWVIHPNPVIRFPAIKYCEDYKVEMLFLMSFYPLYQVYSIFEMFLVHLLIYIISRVGCIL